MDHHTRQLAGTSHCNVRQCSCGMLHVTIGPLTMRLEPGAAETLRAVLGAALEELEGEAARTEARPRLRLATSRGDDLSS